MKGNTRIAAPLGLLLLALAPFAQAQQEGNAPLPPACRAARSPPAPRPPR